MKNKEYNGKFTCLNCGSHKQPKVGIFNQNTDADCENETIL